MDDNGAPIGKIDFYCSQIHRLVAPYKTMTKAACAIHVAESSQNRETWSTLRGEVAKRVLSGSSCSHLDIPFGEVVSTERHKRTAKPVPKEFSA